MTIVLAFVLLLGLVGVLVIAARRSPAGEGGDTGQTVRRFFQYLLLYGLLVVVANGGSGLLSRLIDRGELVRFDDAQLARSLAFLVIGLPLYVALGWWSFGRLRSDPEERRSLGWAVYITFASLTALVMAMVSLYDVLVWVARVDDYAGASGPDLLVWGAIWVLHRVVEAGTTPPERSRAHHLAGSLIGLGAAATGLGGVIGWVVENLVRSTPDLVGEPESALLRSGATLVVGSLAWVLYWVRLAAKMPRRGLWLGYVLVVGVAGGLLTLLGAASLVLHDVLVWFIGQPTTENAASHFGDSYGSVGTAAAAALVWWYHRSLVADRSGTRGEPGRVYDYLISGVGLLATAAGVAVILVALFEGVAGSGGLVVSGGAINTLLGAFTLLAVGVPVWWSTWKRIRYAVVADPDAEAGSPSRRVYLFLLFGVGGVVAVVSLIVVVFIFIEDAIEGALSAETLRSARYGLALLLATAVVAGYHWTVYRDDRRRVSHVRRGPRYVLLIGAPDTEVGPALAHRTGGRVDTWARTDDNGGRWDVDELYDALSARDDRAVVVIAAVGGFEVIPVERG